MIFVTVGTAEYPFDRLLSEMDIIASGTDEPVVMQTGFSDKDYPHTKYSRFMPEDEMRSNYDRARILVCHAGVGTIMNGLERGIPIVMFPRRTMYDEVDTDHQLMIAKKVVDMGRGICVEDVSELGDAMERAGRMELSPYVRNRELCNYISDVLDGIESRMEGKRHRRYGLRVTGKAL